MKRSKLIFILTAVMLLSITLVSCGNEDPPVLKDPVITVSSETVGGKVRTPVTLPTATASDEKDGDLTADLRIKILFQEDEKYVLPAVRPNDGVALNDNLTYTPVKIGTYKVTYFVKNKAGREVSKVVILTATANEDDVRGQNLIGLEKREDWIAGESGQNSTVNEFGEPVIVGAQNTNFTGAVYQGRKFGSGEVVSFTFRAEPTAEVQFYSISFLLTPSSDLDKPVASEGTWPMYFNLRMSSSEIDSFIISDNNNNMDMFNRISVNLCDGNVHTMSLCFTADAEKVLSEIWIDKLHTESPSSSSTIQKNAVLQKYGQDTAHVKVFDPNIKGWLSFGAVVKGPTSVDSMILKSLSFDGASDVLTPELKVESPNLMIVGRESSLPKATAKDRNDYSDLASRIECHVKAPGESEYALNTTGKLTSSVAGEYSLKYVVTDRSGNVEYKFVTLLCSKGDTAEPPVIAFEDSVLEEYEVSLNTDFTIPLPSSVKDSFGDDISSRLTVRLIGREQLDLRDVNSFIFRAAGENLIEYTVTDYNGNLTVRYITVNVTGTRAGNILENENNLYLGSGVTVKEGAVTIGAGDTSFAYGGQKIYDEKVSMIVNLDFASTAGKNDGTNTIVMNIRGGRTANKVPKTAANPSGTFDFNWPDGLSIMFSNQYGLILKPTGYNSSDYAVAKLDGSIYETFQGKDVLLSFQTTDEYNDAGELTGIRFRLWLNGEKVSFGGPFAEESGEVLLTKRVISLNPNLTQAGWLSAHFLDIDTVNGEKSVIHSITIDGTKPVRTTVSIDKEADQKFVLGEAYTLPVVTVTVDGVDCSSQVKKFIWIEGTAKPDFTGVGHVGLTVTPDMTYKKGFKVIYIFNGKEIKTVSVTTDLQVDVSFGQESYTATVGGTFALPVFTATMGSIDVTADVTCKLLAGYEEAEIDGPYKVTVNQNFVLNYYVYGNLVKTITVTVSGGAAKDQDLAENGGHVTGAPAWAYTNEQIYNNKVAVKFSLSEAFGKSDVIDFALRGNSQDAGDWFHYQTGLLIRLKYDPEWGVYLMVGIKNRDLWFDGKYAESEDKYTSVDWTQAHTLVYSVYDVFTDGKFTGIRVEVSLDGKTVRFGQTFGKGDHVLIPAETIKSDGDEYFTPSYLFVWNNQGKITVSEAYLMKVGDAYVPKESAAERAAGNLSMDAPETAILPKKIILD